VYRGDIDEALTDVCLCLSRMVIEINDRLDDMEVFFGEFGLGNGQEADWRMAGVDYSVEALTRSQQVVRRGSAAMSVFDTSNLKSGM
jgi:hypothetical protein